MPGKVKVKIISGRNLPVMDRSSDTTDAYVEIKLGSTTYKTDVCRKSLHPQWNSEWYRFEVDDSELQDEPLQIRLMDHDTYSANDAIGKVYLDLNPLLLPTAGAKYLWNGESNKNHDHSSNSVMSGWIPVYDTMHGIRGEVNIVVKVELFSDFNRFRQSSCGIQFFCSKSIPYGYFAQTVHGFVEELLVNDDPEYQWIDKIRTPRASNEARQTLFFKLSGELQRKIGVKALDLGGNAVIGYCQCFDLEGESGIVARGIGTAVTLVKLVDVPHAGVPEAVNEERAQSYLKFLSADAGFRLNPGPVKPIYSCSKLAPLVPGIDLDHPRYKQVAKCLHTTNLNQHLRHTQSNPTLNRHIHHPNVRILLRQEELRGRPSYGIGRKIKNLKYSSQNMLSKKMIALKAKLGDAGIGEEFDEEKAAEETKRKGPFNFARAASDSSVMAELLARSVIHAHNSLSCILENQDLQSQSDDDEASYSESVTPNTLEDLEPVSNLLGKTVSEPFLSAQNILLDTHSSNVSSSSSDSSSTDEEEDSNSIKFETVSNIIKNVEILDKQYASYQNKSNFTKQFSLPAMLDAPDDDLTVEESNPFVFPEIINKEEDEINFSTSFDLAEMDEEKFSREFYTSENFEDENKAPMATLETDSSSSDENGLVQSMPQLHGDVTQEPETIIPPVMTTCNLKHQSLMKTAMQTMLLEKARIVGTYTPPVSPTRSNVMSFGSNSSNSIQSHKSLSATFLSTPGPLPRSSTALSLSEWSRNHETVLGAPFTSMYNIRTDLRRQQSNPCFTKTYVSSKSVSGGEIGKQSTQTCFSDTELHKSKSGVLLPLTKTDGLSQDSINKNKFNFLSLLGRSHNAEGETNLKLGGSHEHLPKRKISFFALNRRKSHDPNTNLKKVKSEDFHKGRFLFLRRRRHFSENEATSSPKEKSHFLPNIFQSPEKSEETKKQGLLGSALGSVVMKTVQDILATSHAEKNKNAEEKSLLPENDKAPSSPPVSELTCTTNNNNNTPSVFINKEIESTACGSNNMHASLTPSLRDAASPIPEVLEQGHHRAESVGTRIQSPAKLNAVPCIHRRSSDSDLSITPKGNSLSGSDRPVPPNFIKANMLGRATVPQENFDMLEYPFLTMSKCPFGFIQQIGGAVSARSVKLLERISNFEEPESRDTWWSEIRMEIRSHARALNCNAVLGYSESTSICEDVCVLSASGTAAVIGFQYTGEMGDTITELPVIPKPHNSKDLMSSSLDRNDFEREKNNHKPQDAKHSKQISDSPKRDAFASHILAPSCAICHLPYNMNNVPIRATVLKCGLCRSGKVPDVLIATIEVPEGIPTLGRGCFVQSFVCRQLKDIRGETNAKEISDGLPFLEYELHRLLINKLKIKGMNSIFGLKVRISIGEKMLVGIATGTAVFLTPLPAPVLPKLVSDRSSDEKKLADLQKLLNETVKRNREIYQLKSVEEHPNGRFMSDDDSEEEQTSLDLAVGSKDCCVLEVDDPEDAEVVNMLMEERPPDGFHVINTEFIPGLEDLEIVKNLQMFTQIYRSKFTPPYNFEVHLHRLLQSVYFKLRRMVPCALCELQFRVDLPEPDEIQLCVLGMALGLGEPQKLKFKRRNTVTKRHDDDLIFNLEEDQIPENSVSVSQNYLSTQPSRLRQKSPLRNRIQTVKQRHLPYKERHGVDITPLSYVPGGKIDHYLGNLNFFFIRETTSIREEGGLSGFIHSFVTEVLAIVRAHVTALGGNAMVAYFMTECVLNHSLHKNQGQCLINVGGDVVFVSYFQEDA